MKKNYFTTTLIDVVSFSKKKVGSPFQNCFNYSFLLFITMLMIDNSGFAQTPIITSLSPASGPVVSAASSTPTLCINTPLTNITHTTATVTGIILPPAPIY
jgi:hypothetical protein